MDPFPGKVWEIHYARNYLGQICMNVFHYGCLDLSGNAEELMSLWGAFMPGQIATVQNTGVTGRYALGFGVQNAVDIAAWPVDDIVGLRTGDGLPPTNCLSFIGHRIDRSYRNAYKRFEGIAEPDQTNGRIVTGGAFEAAIDTLESELNNTFTAGGDEPVYIPLVIQRQRDKVVLDEPRFFPLSSWSFLGITTQNTRKFGHGD